MKDLDKQHKKIRLLLEQKGYARKRRENVRKNHDIISENSGSTRYGRRTETKIILEFTHGGVEASFY